ncbi:MAG: anaerobic sulfatase maturase [Tidjanibacter sp.]|nr:anaerobic sulfatase maturase [Tidjanibacter sp.]
MSRKKIVTFDDARKMVGPTIFSSMLKPSGSTCNLDCHYCYYLDKAEQYGGRQALMSDELLESYIRQFIAANEGDEVLFCWHGGEPLLAGKEYFRRAIEYQQRYAEGKQISNTIQTNGTLLDREWCELFAENNFLVGISLDGPEDIHDAFRRTKGGAPTFSRVMQGVRLMQEMGVEYNTLSVVNALCEGRGGEIYRFFRDEVGSRYMQFLPAVEHVIEREGRRPLIVSPSAEGATLAEWSVSAEGYGRFLCDIFDRWVVSDVGQVFVQIFDATLAGWCGIAPGLCTLAETCGDALAVEHNGDVYPCDHFVYPEYLLGNIASDSLSDIYHSPLRQEFALDKRNTLPRECMKCRFFHCCHGECPKHRFDKGVDGSPKNRLCEGLKMWFAHSEPYMLYMRELLARGMSPAFVMPYARKRMGLM